MVPSTLDTAATLNSRGAVEQAVEIGQIEVAVISDGEPAQLDALLGGQHVPGDDVGVVLQLGDDHRVARSQIGMAPGSGHQVDRLSSVLGEDHLGGPGCADKAGDLGPGLLQSLGGFHRQLVGAAVDVGVEALVVVGEGVDHQLGFLGGGRRVEINQAAAVHLPAHDGKVGPDDGWV